MALHLLKSNYKGKQKTQQETVIYQLLGNEYMGPKKIGATVDSFLKHAHGNVLEIASNECVGGLQYHLK